MHHKLCKIFTAALALTAAASSLQAQRARNDDGPLEFIALQTYVDGRSDTYSVKPAEYVPVRTGERIRIHLVGTAIVNNAGVERPVRASFTVAAGKGNIEIVQSGPEWVVVQVKSRGSDGLAQLGYEVNGDYQMKGGLKWGRITLEIEEGQEESAPAPGNGGHGNGGGSVDRNRWDRARDLTERLYNTIIDEEPRGETARRDTEHIYEMGAIGVRDVALALADDAGSDYDRLSEDEAIEVLGDLYRGLLRRTGDNDRLWDEDRGFRTNVDTLRRQGYARMIRVILDAGEFTTANDLRNFGYLAGHDGDDNWRDHGSRYAVPR